MTMLQEQAVRMIQDMSDDNVGFLLEVIQRLIPKKTYTSVIYPSQKSDEKMQAFKELVATRYEAKKYLPDDFDPDAELEAARKEDMIVLIDTNVIIDFLVAREPFYDSALRVMEKCASGEADGYMAFHSLPNLWYILRKVPAETRRLWLEKVCMVLKVACASQEAVMAAIKMDNFIDFEDCLQDRCAEEVSANYIITRNTSDFEASVVSAIEPDEWLKKIN